MTHDLQPLTKLLSGNRMAVSDAIRYALNIGSELRRIHADGRCHGALTPELIQVSASGARLLPATPGAVEDLTPYTAPEILEGEPADARTDIFAFGAVLYVMATVRHAFLADSPEALEAEIRAKAFSPIGHERLDHLVKQCLAKEPSARWQRMQPIQMELRLLAIAARLGDPGVMARHYQLEAEVHAELEQQASLLAELELAVTARTTEMSQAVTAALEDVQSQFAEVGKCLETSQQRVDHFANSVVKAAESTQREMASLQVGLAGEVHAIEQATKGQALTIESIKASIARNDDYVERVVEALEGLQKVILDQPEVHQTVHVALAS